MSKSVSKAAFNQLIAEKDFAGLLQVFDQDAPTVRRLLTRITYSPETLLHGNAIEAFCFLSKERGAAHPQFFREIIRRHVWGMNDEGGNIDWSAPEIIGATIAGSPDLFSDFIPIMFYAAVGEPTFRPSLIAALEMIAQIDPAEAARYLEELQVAEKSNGACNRSALP